MRGTELRVAQRLPKAEGTAARRAAATTEKGTTVIDRRYRLSEKAWLELLADPGTEIELDLQGLQGRYEPGPGWDTGVQKIGQHLVYFISEGQCSAAIDGKRLLPTAGSLSWVCPGTPFRFFHGSGEKSPVVYRFRFSVVRRGVVYAPTGHFRFVGHAWSVFELVRQLVLEAERNPEPTKATLSRAQLQSFSRWRKQGLISLLSIGAFEGKPAAKREMVFDDAQRMAISAFMAEATPGKRTAAGLARHLGLSHDYFSRIFRRSYGMSPRTWLLRQRLAEGAMLLRESTRRISEIAERLGYGEMYLFSRQFRQVYGVGPRQWRKAG
jgi:AraC-like DNA-binding protein